MDIKEAIRAVTEHRDLDVESMTAVMRQVMTGEATPAQIGAFLVGLRMKGETVGEIAAAAGVMRELATRVEVGDVPHLVDTCGTGGDGASTFNISTAAAFVAAAAGAHVAKHGNRSVSSRTGSADVLEAAGINLDIDAAGVARCIREAGVGFMFAPAHHSAMKHAVGPRKEIGVRTLFNVLGPLTNPADAPYQLLGVYDEAWLEPLAQVLGRLGSRHVLVVHAEDGLDEISIGGPTQVAELRGGTLERYAITPEQFGLERGDLQRLVVDRPEQSLAITREVLDDQPGPARDIVILNAGAALYAADVVESLAEGVEAARAAIRDGRARERMEALTRLSTEIAAA